ncbi:MAG: TatD family hydrolase [Nitrososphaerales archaeon]
MFVDSHSHLDNSYLDHFTGSLKAYNKSREEKLHVFSNSVDIESSRKNLELAKKEPESITSFVGIHPEILSSTDQLSFGSIEEMCAEIATLVKNAGGIGEIGLDPKYGNASIQEALFERQLRIAEKCPDLPLNIHSRDSVKRVIDILSTFSLKNHVLFHWFSGSEIEAKISTSRGYYVSFGPSLLYSKRLCSLLREYDASLILSETDSPLVFSSFSKEVPITPFALSSVVFRMAEVKLESYGEMVKTLEDNACTYQSAKLIKGERAVSSLL